MYIIITAIIFLILSVKQINEYERGVKFSFGKFNKIMNPGWNIVIPLFQSYKKVDIRTKVIDVPEQEVITKDNISVRINAVVYFKLFDAGKAILEIENYYYAVGQIAQTTMRNIVGTVTLDQLLSGRETISDEIQKIVDEATDPWGIKVDDVELKDISLPEEIKRVVIALQKGEKEGIATPANWKPGDDVIIPAPGSCGAAKERMDSQGSDHYCLDWFLCFKKEKK